MKKDLTKESQLQQQKFTNEHTLSKEQVKKLLEKKFARAKLYSQALKQREDLLRYR